MEGEVLMGAFQTFYDNHVPRLREKMKVRNQKLACEANEIIRPFFKDMADLNEGGKYLRGLLVNLGFHMAGFDDCRESDEAALAFEMFQTGVLIHDDVIDRAKYRRGKKTITHRYGESLEKRGLKMPAEGDTAVHLTESAAICCGDYLITASQLCLARAYASHQRALTVISEFDRIILDTIRGELLDVVLPCEMQDETRRPEEANELLIKSVYDIYHLKTSRYSVVGPLRLGLLLGGVAEEKTEAVDRMADELGIAFQIKDDILGIYGDAEKTGKDAGSDISEYKQTLLYAYIRGRRPEKMAALNRYYGHEKLTAEDIERVRELFEESGARAYAEQEMEACFRRAEQKLAALDFIKTEDRAVLEDFIAYSRHRKK